MKVRIVQNSSPLYWYANKIGYEFEVINCERDRSYKIVNNETFNDLYILKVDCIVVL
jgi:hypothetical protein